MRMFSLALAGVAAMSSIAAAADAPAIKPGTATVPVVAPAPVASPHIVMLRLYVANIARGEKFYHELFGATSVQNMGENVRIMVFPGGAVPGIILIQSKDEATMNGSFVTQVPDLKATLERAQANGGKLLNSNFTDRMAGMPMQSSHFYDPDGNLIEALQVGEARAAK